MSPSSASGCFLASSEGGDTSIRVCLLELSPAGTLSDLGGDLRLSLGGGADLSVGTCSTGCWSCATATPVNQRQSTARIRYLSLIHISEPTRRTPISYAVF